MDSETKDLLAEISQHLQALNEIKEVLETLTGVLIQFAEHFGLKEHR